LNFLRSSESERGSILILTTIAMVAVLGFAALAIDGGYMYFKHTRLQDVADSAALGASVQLVKTPGNAGKKKREAFEAARRSIELNGLEPVDAGQCGDEYTMDIVCDNESGKMTVSVSDELDLVEVRLTLGAQTFFGRSILGAESPISVEAAVQIGRAGKQTGNLVPIAFFWGDYEPYERYDMTLSPGSGQGGNYGFLDYKPSNMFKEYLAEGYDGTLSVGQKVETYPGVNSGQVHQAIEERIARCRDGCSVTCIGGNVQVNVKPTCPRLVMVPIVDDFFEQNGRGYVTVKGFAKFFIERYDEGTKVLSGWFLQDASSSDINGSAVPFMVQAVRLVR